MVQTLQQSRCAASAASSQPWPPRATPYIRGHKSHANGSNFMVMVLNSTPPAENALAAAPRRTLAGLNREGLNAALAAIGVPERQRRMRVGQLWTWLYAHGVTSFDAMTDVSKDL